ncbi:hypothetical protein Tco_0910177 [Tanacetum coccineum]|uniref:Uncharacterized protein n=1 Tax=Tanacetum coccineum TaxID=301880 RepID=A0ABQ5CTZ5_9ASTR
MTGDKFRQMARISLLHFSDISNYQSYHETCFIHSEAEIMNPGRLFLIVFCIWFLGIPSSNQSYHLSHDFRADVQKGIVIIELGTPTITRSSQQPSQEKVQNKGKEKMIKPKKPLKKKDLIRLDEEIASQLQAEFDKEERLAMEKDEANVALTEEWDDI